MLLPPIESAQYASAQITAFALKNGITRSMGLTGIRWDNAMAESFFATLKTEFYYRRVWPTRDRATRKVGAWIEDRYNRRRRHSSIGDVTPVTFELQYSSQTAEVQLAAYPVSTNRGQGQCRSRRRRIGSGIQHQRRCSGSSPCCTSTHLPLSRANPSFRTRNDQR